LCFFFFFLVFGFWFFSPAMPTVGMSRSDEDDSMLELLSGTNINSGKRHALPHTIKLWRRALAECVGTFILVLCGSGVDIQVSPTAPPTDRVAAH
jgi:hypothetical protein